MPLVTVRIQNHELYLTSLVVQTLEGEGQEEEKEGDDKDLDKEEDDDRNGGQSRECIRRPG